MKKIMGVLMGALIVLSGCNLGPTTVPAEVATAFTVKFPEGKKVKWEKENSEEWEAVFKMNEINYSANFSNSGEWLETEYEINEGNLPKIILKAVNDSFSDYSIEKIEVSETKNSAVYEFELINDEQTIEIIINSLGKVMRKETVEDEEDEKGESN